MITASPMRLQVICEESNLCTLSWQQPPIYYARQGTLLNYFANCSTMDARRDDQATTNVTCSFTYTSLRLQPCLFYNCCVAAVNEAGRGNSACQTILTHEAGTLHYYHYIVKYTAPTAVPANTEVYQLNSTCYS